MAYFTYDGGPATSPSSYTLVGSEPSCGGNDLLCGIQADASGSNPILTQQLKDEMLDALAEGIPSANVFLLGERDTR
mgnify:CR=1 FL=1